MLTAKPLGHSAGQHRPKTDVPVGSDTRQLTGLRGFAALNVALTHFGIGQVPVLGLFAFGNSAVDLFFCLSSFTLCLVYKAGTGVPLSLRNYGVARIARVYPLFMTTMLATLWYGMAWSVDPFPHTSVSALLTQFVRQATLLSEIPLPFLGPMGCWDNAAWSISIEAFCYVLIFPPLFSLTARASRLTVSSTVLLTVVLGATCFTVFLKFFDPNVNGPFFPQPANSISLWVPLVRGVTMFGAGWLVYVLYLAHRDDVVFVGKIADVLALSLLAIVASEHFGLLASASVVIVAPFVVLSLMNVRTLTARVLASPPLHYLGVISYSIYLWHMPARMLALRLWPWQSNHHVFHAIIWPTLVTLTVSASSYFLIEMPSRKAIKRVFQVGSRVGTRQAA